MSRYNVDYNLEYVHAKKITVNVKHDTDNVFLMNTKLYKQFP